MAFNPREGTFSAGSTHPNRVPTSPVFVQSDPYYLDDEGMGVDYGQRYARRPVVRDQFAENPQARMAEVKQRNEAQTISRVAASQDDVARYLASGYAKDKTALATAVQAGDRATTEKVLGRMSAFREANHKALAGWAVQGDWGGKTVAGLAKAATEIINEEYATNPISVGYDGAGKPVKHVSAQSFLDTGLNTVGDVVAGYLEKGFRTDMAEMEMAARSADIEGVRAIAQRIGKFAEDNRDGLFRWSRYGAAGGAQGAQLQALAQQIQSGAYLDVPFDYGFGAEGKPEGQYSARALISGEGMPAVKKRAAQVAANRYGVGTRAAQIITDPDEPLHGLFGAFLNDIAAGEAMQKSQQDPQPGIDRVVRARSGLQLVSEHLAEHEDKWSSPQAAEGFYRGVYSSFGGSLSKSQLNELYEDFTQNSSAPGFDVNRYFQDWRDIASSIAPTEQVQVKDGQNVRTVDVQSRFADPQRLLDTAFDVKTRLRESGLATSSPLVKSALRTQARALDEIEKTIGVTLADLGYGDALAASTVYALSGDRDDLAAGKVGGSDANVIYDAKAALDQTAQMLNIGDKGDNADTGMVLPGVAEAIRSATGRAYLEGRKTSQAKAFADMLGDDAFADSLRGAVSSAVRKTLGVEQELSDALAEKFVDNMRSGRNQSVQGMLEEIGRRVKTVKKPDGTEEIVRTESRKFVSPATGVETNEVPKVGAGVGMFSMTAVSPGVPHAQKIAARTELSRWADGTSDVFKGMDAELVAPVRDLARDVQDSQRKLRRGDGPGSTSEYAGDAARVLEANLRLFGVDLARVRADDFLSSGDLFRWVEGHDRYRGKDDPGLNDRAVAALQRIGKSIATDAEMSEVDRRVAISLFADVLTGLAQRGEIWRLFRRKYTGFGADEDRPGWKDGDIGELLDSVGVGGKLWSMKMVPGLGTLSGGRAYSQAEFRRVNDSEAALFREDVKTRLSEEFGVDPIDGLSAAGFVRPEGDRQTLTNDYGLILARFEQLYRGQTVHKDTPTGGEDTPAPADAVPAHNVADMANRVLSRTLSSDTRLNRLKADLRRAIVPQFDSPEEAAAMFSRMEPLIDMKWQTGGYDAAKKFVDAQGSTVVLYRRGTNQMGEDVVEPQRFTASQLDELATYSYGTRDWQALFQESRINKELFDRQAASDVRVAEDLRKQQNKE